MEQTDETPKWERDTKAYRGLVLMRACNIVRHRLKLATWNEMAALLAVSAKSLTTYRSGKPIGQMPAPCFRWRNWLRNGEPKWVGSVLIAAK